MALGLVVLIYRFFSALIYKDRRIFKTEVHDEVEKRVEGVLSMDVDALISRANKRNGTNPPPKKD